MLVIAHITYEYLWQTKNYKVTKTNRSALHILPCLLQKLSTNEFGLNMT